MRVALVHDDLVQWGGAERVLLALTEAFPEAPVYTSVFDKNNTLLNKYFGSKKIITSFIQKIPGWKNLYKLLLPLYPIAFEQFDFSEFDLVISQTTRFAKSIITKPSTKHICYCHTPPRFLWHFSGEKHNFLLEPVLSYLRIFDQISAQRIDYFVAGSINASKRIKKIYRAESQVIYPFVDWDRFSKDKSFDGGYLLVVSRLNSYKRVDLVIEAAKKLNLPLKIVGTGSEIGNLMTQADDHVDFLGNVSEDLLINLISGCKALIVAAEEDFGLTPIEAASLGKPVIAYKKGGALETVIDNETGFFFGDQTSEGITEALKKLDKNGYNKKACWKQTQQFTRQKFIQKFQTLASLQLSTSFSKE